MCKIFVVCVLLVIADGATWANASITELCEADEDIDLYKSGKNSTVTIYLNSTHEDGICKLMVRAPKTHAVNLQIIEDFAEENETGEHPPCVMSIFLPGSPKIPVWKGDLCSSSPLHHDDLLTSEFKIVWNPPANPALTKGRKLVLTAVGQGQVCKEPGQHTCMRIGWDPMLCVSDALLCDGFANCPKSSTTSDEDDKLCKKRFFAPTSLEQLAVEWYKKFKPQLEQNFQLDNETNAASVPKIKFFNWREFQESTEAPTSGTTTTKRPPRATDSVSQVLSKYGPWGYLMLGMLICGTVLMFCGLWECCFKKPKTEIEAPNSTPPTTVLIINQQETPAEPPNYEEIEPPPSYTTLFPHLKSTSETSVQTCETEVMEETEERTDREETET